MAIIAAANPLFISDGPTVRGKRYRLLSRDERAAFMSNPRDDLEKVSYEQTMEWLANTNTPLEIQIDTDEEAAPDFEAVTNWSTCPCSMIE